MPDKVFFLAILMYGSVNLQHQPGRRAVEINYETLDSMLPPEFKAEQTAVAKVLPQYILGFRRLFSHLPRQRFKFFPQLRAGTPSVNDLTPSPPLRQRRGG